MSKRRRVHRFQKYVANPPLKALLRLGIMPPSVVLLETTGRRSGKPRRTPVGDGVVDDTLWIVAEHGRQAGYVRNLEADPRVRVRVRAGLRARWRTGTAHVMAADDPLTRQRWIERRRPTYRINAPAVRAMGTELLTVRVDLDP
ncbi:MAG TPA: nitroreductase/quinone reductase family protein [Solirubrobacteraceae bacterium]|nr:nitroreductase/quinone reductase family protein [Solirubrobacteraceae bacterium]